MPIKTSYPANSSTAITLTLASLATDANLLAGRASTAVNNTGNLDLDHLLSGRVQVGTSPTINTFIEFWVYAPISMSSGTPTYPDSITGSDANKSATSRNVLFSSMTMAHRVSIDNVSDRNYYIPQLSIASLFGGTMPEYWGLWVVHNTGVALNASEASLHYHRRQMQSI